MILPIFRSHFSLGASTFTLEVAEDKIQENAPNSVFTIAKAHDFNEVYLVEKSMTGFLQAAVNSEKSKLHLRFGLELLVVGNAEQKDEESFSGEHKVVVWLKNMRGYKDLCKLATYANTEGFYYTSRIDEKNLRSLLTENLSLSIPFYDSFIANNLLKFNMCMFDYEYFNPVFFTESSNLPFDVVIQGKLDSLKLKNTQRVKNIYYYKESDFETYMAVKCISKRASTFDKPNLEHFASNAFSFETWQKQNI